MFQLKKPKIIIESPLAQLVWQGPILDRVFKEEHLGFTKLMPNSRFRYLLLDYRQAALLRPEEQYWLINEWLPFCVHQKQANIEKIALISQKESFKSIRVPSVSAPLRTLQVDMMFFSKKETGLEWLFSSNAL